MSWKTRINHLWPDVTFFPPADQTMITHAEHTLQIRFPAELIALFRETDGFTAHYATPYLFRLAMDVPAYDQLVGQNLLMQTTPDFADLYAPFDDILVIGADGGGSLFGYQLVAGQVTSTILLWDHETDDRTPVSMTGLDGYLAAAAKFRHDDS